MERVLPQNIEAEVGVLGSILLNNEVTGEILQELDKSYFYHGAHQIIFEAIGEIYDKNLPIDLVILKDELKRRNLLEKVGGIEYLIYLMRAVPSTAHVEYYTKIVRDNALVRHLIKAAEQIKRSCLEEHVETEQLLDKAEQLIFELSQKNIRREAVPIDEILRKTFDVIEQYSSRRGMLTGISTGFYELDKLMSGLQNSHLIIIAGRPSMGKTSFALNLAEHAAVNEGLAVAIFSLEMAKEQLVQNMLCCRARISPHALRSGSFDQKTFSTLSSIAGDFYQAKIFIDDTPGLSVRNLRNKARRIKLQQGLDLVIIDYLQLMEAGGRFESRQQEIARISRSLKALARELDIPVIALSQLNRSVDARDDHRPRMSDLRESGALEQDADVIIFLYREEYYNHDTEHKGTAEVIIAKQRNGPVDRIRLSFLKEYMRFENTSNYAQTAVPL